MKTKLTLTLFAFVCAGAPAPAQRLLDNVQLGGSANQLKSGATLTLLSGSTLTVASGATVNGLLTPAAADAAYQPLDADLTGIAALTTTSFGRALLEIADAAALRTDAGLGTIATAAAGDYVAVPASSAEGDILFRNASTWTRLARGTDGQVLKATATTIEWGADAGGLANPMTTAGDMIVGGTAGAPARLAVGTDGQVLKVASGAITWGTDSTGAGGGGGSLTLARWTALGNQPPAANYATFDTRNEIAVLDFDAATAESAVFVGVIPEGADFTTGVTVRLVWMATSATSGDVVWTTAFERGNTDLDADDFATGIDSSATTTNGTSGIAAITSIDHSGAQIDGLAAGELFRLKVTRKAADAADTMTGDAELIAVELRQR